MSADNLVGLVLALVAVHRPLGEYMARVLDNPSHSRPNAGCTA